MKPLGTLGPRGKMADVSEYTEALERGISKGLSLRSNIQGQVIEDVFLTVPAPTWHAIGDTGEPAFSNNWQNYGGGFNSAGFRMLPTGRVRLRGLVQRSVGGAVLGEAMFTLPSGARPAVVYGYRCASDNGAGGYSDTTVYVQTTGAVTWQAGYVDFVFLDDIEFDVDPTNCNAPDTNWTGGGFPIVLPTRVKNPLGIEVLKVRPRVADEAVGQVYVDWMQRGAGSVIIKSIHGLQPSRSYHLTLFVAGDE